MILLGYDIGSSSVKASLVDAETGKCLAAAFHPKTEMEIIAQKPGWAEQEPENWWKNLVLATKDVLAQSKIKPDAIVAIGISYQMHGLVIVDKNHQVLRPSIIWCDSRAVSIGEKAFGSIGKDKCLHSLLNSPGNFTASKLRWVMENEPSTYEKIYRFMLPGDYIAFRMSGELCTTSTGLSEGILWDFRKNQVADLLLKEYKIPAELVPPVKPVFSVQGELSVSAAAELGLKSGTPISYRAGDQPNNALSLNVLNPGEIAATAGTSGVVYGVSGEVKYDPQSRVNTFAHVNHETGKPRLGVLLCINGTGILNSWIRKNLTAGLSYEEMNQLAAKVPAGSEGLVVLPFGNGAERVLGNRETGASFINLNFNIHGKGHLLRAAQEGIIFSFAYGMEVMKETGINPGLIRAGNANMFLSPLFRQSLADLTEAQIELYDTDGSQGSARGAGIGAGIFKNPEEAFSTLERIAVIEPNQATGVQLRSAYVKWLEALKRQL
ncbi:MAG: FGGY family carbohydrate kinase [Bacteroidales bacterium]